MTIKNSINTLDRLYLIRQSIINVLSDCENELSKESNIEKVEELEQKIQFHNNQLIEIDNRVMEIRKEFFQFSVEELYSMYGKFDKFISITFHPNSESSKLFGKTIMGTIIYSRREREDIIVKLNSNPVPRTNGYVKIESSELDNLNEAQRSLLKTKGVISGDIFEIYNTPVNYYDSYSDKNIKEIPNKININLNSIDFNSDLIGLRIYEIRIRQNNKPLIESEWNEYYAYKILYNSSEISNEVWDNYIYEPNTKIIKERIRYYLLRSKFFRGLPLTDEEKMDFKDILSKRIKEGSEIVDKEIARSTNNKISAIINNNIEIVTELKSIAYTFEDINLSPYGAKHPVFLDLERYLHIFIRHLKDFQLGNWKDGKTSFQYSFRDTKRLIEIVIKELQSQIDIAIDSGKEFNIYDMKAYYFNGNYYTVHVDKNGRLLSFYPHENK